MDDVISNFRDPNVKAAVKSLMVYSLTILAVPLGSMFFLKHFLFEGAFFISMLFSFRWMIELCFLL